MWDLCDAQDSDSYAKGKELFRNGLLSEAVLALEAEAQRSPGNVEAWRLLGTVHAENDDDQQVRHPLGVSADEPPSGALYVPCLFSRLTVEGTSMVGLGTLPYI